MKQRTQEDKVNNNEKNRKQEKKEIWMRKKYKIRNTTWKSEQEKE